jgi:hypothetical protein
MGVTSARAFSVGEFETASQVAWGDDGNFYANKISAQFGTVYPSGVLGIGIPPPPGFSLTFDDAQSVLNYLPANGAPGVLNANLNDAVTSSSGAFGGEMVALTINVDFSDAGLLAHPQGVPFGDLILTGLTGTQALMNGLTVRELLSDMNILIGAGISDLNVVDADIVANELNMSFNGGMVVSTFAQDNLELPPSATPLPATLPLFATGLAGAGLLGWRKKRKVQAVA